MGADQEDVFQQLHGYYRRVVHLFRHLGFPRETAEDLTQETFYRVIQSMASYRGEARWAYLETTARRVALNRIRHDNAGMRHGIDVAVEQAAELSDPSSVPADERVYESEKKKRLGNAVAQLDQRSQSLVNLYIADFSYREIADVLGTTEGAVRTALRDIRKRLREIVGENLDGFGGDS